MDTAGYYQGSGEDCGAWRRQWEFRIRFPLARPGKGIGDFFCTCERVHACVCICTCHVCGWVRCCVLCLVLSCAQSRPTLGDPWTAARQAPLPMEILQARILEWVTMPCSRGSPNPGIEPRSPALQADSLYHLSHQGSPCICINTCMCIAV